MIKFGYLMNFNIIYHKIFNPIFFLVYRGKISLPHIHNSKSQLEISKLIKNSSKLIKLPEELDTEGN
jgi:hypothetical protein